MRANDSYPVIAGYPELERLSHQTRRWRLRLVDQPNFPGQSEKAAYIFKRGDP